VPIEDMLQSAWRRFMGWLRSLVRPHEVRAVWIAFAYFFCVLAAYYVVRPIRDQLSAAVGSTALPIFYTATFVATLSLTPVFGALVARFPRRVFVPVVYAFFIVGMIGFIPLFQMQDAIGPRVLGSIFFVWVSVFNLFVVAVFWSLMADLFGAEQSRRLFPIIALGGAAGAIAGPMLIKVLNAFVGITGLLVVSSALLAVSIVCIRALSAWSRLHPVVGDERRDERIIGGGFLAGAKETLKSPLMRRFAFLMLLGDAVGTVIYAFLADYSGATFSTARERIDFSLTIDFWTNVLQALFQVTLTRTLMTRFGPAVPLALDGIVKAIMLVLFAFFAGPWIAAVAIFTRASAYGIFKPAVDSLYTQVDAETRYKTKNFIDTSVWRFGDVAVNGSLNGLRLLGATQPLLVALTVVAAMSSARIGWQAARSVVTRAASKDGGATQARE